MYLPLNSEDETIEAERNYCEFSGHKDIKDIKKKLKPLQWYKQSD